MGDDTLTRRPAKRDASKATHLMAGPHRANRAAVRHVLKRPLVQPKLTVSAPDDTYEREADRVAERLMRMPAEAAPGASAHCPACASRIQRQPAADEGMRPSPDTAAQIQAIRGGGRPLPASERAFFEPRFGRDFGDVRLHTDDRAADLARRVHARAFTVGQDVVMGAGEYSPGSPSSRRLLAHELTHTVQQSQAEPQVQRYTAYSTTQQANDNSLGWEHPGSTDIRVSDDGRMAVEDKGWGADTNKRAWTTKAELAESNAKLKSYGSNTKLVEKSGNIAGKPPANPSGRSQTLVEIKPEKASGSGPFTLASDCGRACRQVMGSGGGEDVAVYQKGVTERYTTSRTYHGGALTTPEQFFQEILAKEFGSGLTRAQLYDRYANLSASEKEAFDRKYGINEYAVPEVGQGQTISTEVDMPGFSTTGPSTWNFHYAATVLKSGHDQVTLESAAGWGPTEWIFYMYGPANKDQSFHTEHGAMGSHGTHYTTMVVQPASRLKGKTNAAGVHLVRVPARWDTTLITKLPKGTEVKTLRKGNNWQKVEVLTGPHAGRSGWMMNKFFEP